MAVAACSSVALAALSVLVVRPAPSYDPWAWLLWGREVASGSLSTLDGPAFKPLPVFVCAALSALGDAAPVVWVLVARSAAVLAVWLAFRLGRRLAGGSVPAGVLAAAGVALCGDFAGYAASGLSEGLLLALALAGAEAWRAGRPRAAVACAVACGLLRVETWPFLVAGAVAFWRRRPADRRLLLACAIAVPAAWLVPELVGSGQLLRSVARARLPDAGQPALASVPFLASLGQAALLPLWPLWAGAALLVARAWRGRSAPAAGVLVPAGGAAGTSWMPAAGALVPGAGAPVPAAAGMAWPPVVGALVPAAAGMAWMVVVAAMAQGGFSGEARYAVPGAALVAVSGAVGLVTGLPALRAGRPRNLVAVGLAVALGILAGTPRLGELADLQRSQRHQWALQADLREAVALAGGRGRVLGCGTPFVGPRRGPLLAYRLRVARHVVEPDLPPTGPGVVFRSRLTPRAPRAPEAPAGFAPLGRAGTWDVARRC